jgi:hypothetical protein
MTPTPLKKRGGSAGANAAQSAARKTVHLLNCLLIAVRVREQNERGSKCGKRVGRKTEDLLDKVRREKRTGCGSGSYRKNGRSAPSTPDQVRLTKRRPERSHRRPRCG